MLQRRYSLMRKVCGLLILVNLIILIVLTSKKSKKPNVHLNQFPHFDEKINDFFIAHQINNFVPPQINGDISSLHPNYHTERHQEVYPEKDMVNANGIPKITFDIQNASIQKQHYVCVGLEGGRLGNKLYIFSSAYGVAKKKGMRLVIPEGTDVLESAFHVNGTFLKNKTFCDKVKDVGDSGCCKLSQNIMDLPKNQSVRILGYLQSYKYFETYRNEIQNILTFRENVLNDATSKLESLLSGTYGENITQYRSFNRTLIGVHIRRGDYLLKDKQEFGYKVATKEYLYNAMDYMRDKYHNVTFIVCSTDLQWTNSVLTGITDVIIAAVGSAIVDLALLSIMDHTIITVGTYGFWAAWLNKNNGTVIYYKDFKTPNSRYARGFSNSDTDTYYPYWIGM